MKFSRTRFLLLNFQIAHLAHSLVAAAIKCQYITAQFLWNLGVHATQYKCDRQHAAVNFVIATSLRTRPPVAAGGSSRLDGKVGETRTHDLSITSLDILPLGY